MKQKISDLSQKFTDIFGLTKRDFSRHDAVHVMTGFGIGLADELRVAAIEIGLFNSSGSSPSSITKRLKSLREDVVQWYRHGSYRINADETKLGTKRFQKVQSCTLPLNSREVRALVKLGEKMQSSLVSIAGGEFVPISPARLTKLDFSKADFTKEAHAIKEKYEKPRNRKIAEKSAKILFNAARRSKHRKDIPAAGAPWVGPLMKPYSAGPK